MVTDELRENDDGTVSLMRRGRELVRGKAPTGAGVDGYRRMYHPKAGSILRCIQNNVRIIKRQVHLDTLTADLAADADHVLVAATWAGGGAWSKAYALKDMPAACALRRLLLGDLLEARGV